MCVGILCFSEPPSPIFRIRPLRWPIESATMRITSRSPRLTLSNSIASALISLWKPCQKLLVHPSNILTLRIARLKLSAIPIQGSIWRPARLCLSDMRIGFSRIRRPLAKRAESLRCDVDTSVVRRIVNASALVQRDNPMLDPHRRPKPFIVYPLA